MNEDLEIRGPVSPDDLVDWWEEGGDQRPGKPGGKGGKRDFGTGLRAKAKRRGAVVKKAQKKRDEELGDELYHHLEERKSRIKDYRAWVERILANPENVLQEKEVIVSFARPGKPGGQKMQKSETAADALHEPTGTIAHCEETRSKSQNEKRARGVLEERVRALADKWREYEQRTGEARNLFEELN
jgi:hypothetical protein